MLTNRRATSIFEGLFTAALICVPVTGFTYALAGAASGAAGQALAAGVVAFTFVATYIVHAVIIERAAWNMAHPAQAVTRVLDVPAFAAEVEGEFRPGLVFIPTGRGTEAVALGITAAQLAELKRRIRANDVTLPVNGWRTLTTTQARDLRADAVGRGLAEYYGRNQVRWTGDGAVRVLRARPAPVARG